VSRREREARRQRIIYWGMGIAAALCVAILAGFGAWEYLIKPNQTLAQVDGTTIKRRDYWKVRSFELLQQAELFGAQNPMFAEQLRAEARRVWGSTSVDDATLSRMIDDQVILKHIGELGLAVTDQDVRDFIDRQFEPANAPIYTPTPTPTLIPTRAAWATETAQAEQAALTATALAGASPDGGTPESLPEEGGTPVSAASPPMGTSPEAGAPESSPAVTSGSPEASPPASPEASPAVSPTPNQEQARQTAEAGFRSFKDQLFDDAHLSQADYERWIVRPAVARQKVRDYIANQIGQSAEQVHAAHILVATKDLADQLYQQLQSPDADFAQIARDNSIDEATAPNGGDLGWFPRGVMVKPFDDVAFSLQPGQISQPFETEFGWHIVKVYAHEQDRPLTDDMINTLRTKRFEAWLAEKRAATAIKADIAPTPTPAVRTFEPPPDAPPTPTPTPTIEASPAEVPEASPAPGSPVAGP
jgi:parvulin-like peptidyl-prolyl isomerase